MNKLIRILAFAFFCSVPSQALSLQTIFDNQKKTAFPDTCEMQMRTTVALPGVAPQSVVTYVITAGPSKSITTIKSSMMQMKMVQNDGRMKVTDLKTGKTLPAQNMPTQNPADISKSMGEPADYNDAVKFGEGSSKEGTIWKVTPKDASKPTLYYASKMKKVVKMTAVVNGAVSESKFEYCDNSCPLPGTLKKATIKTVLPQGGESNVILEVLKAKPRHVLPSKMFNVE
ncbi:hypothetical protein [Fibrobacter sp.]|uniref:hypothetical protein n=1 Tax=Fibrobacter sp. TaxID=35828 RepID=UPI00388D0FA2